MRVAIWSDLHIFEGWREFDVSGSRLIHCVSVIGEIVDYCVKRKIGVIICAGDLFHKRAVLNTHAYNLTVRELVRAKDAGITCLFVSGNHDAANKSGTIDSIEALADAGLVQAVNPHQGWINWFLEDDTGDSLLVSGFNYTDSREVFLQRLVASTHEATTRYPAAPRIGIFHHGFQEARVGSMLEYQVKEEIDARELEGHGFLRGFAGHYHQRQFIAHTQERAMYIGSPLEHVRGDGGLDKGFLSYESTTDIWRLVPLARPRFVKLTQEQLEAPPPELVKGNYVDVCYEELPQAWDAFAAHLRNDLGAAGVKSVPIVKERKHATRLAIDTSLSTQEILKKYIHYKKDSIAGMDELALLKLGADITSRSTK